MKALPALPGARPALASGLVTLLVWATVGSWAALGALLLLVANWVAGPDRKVAATATVALFVALPFAWLAGSGLPFSPPAPRLQDNTSAHQLGGLAIWMLCVAVWLDISRRRELHDDAEGTEDSEPESRTTDLGHNHEPLTRRTRR
ncbi:MAG: hypothetical protein ABIW49_02940 [Knoellia sp.]